MFEFIWDRVISCLTGPDKWAYILIPFISAGVGWFTNWQAIKMMFYPLKPIGIPPYLGWQGIVPRKIEKMAGTAVDVITTKLISVQEVFDKIDPNRMADEMETPIVAMMPSLISETMTEYAPTVWESLPLNVKDQIIGRCAKDSPKIVADIIIDIKSRVTDFFDLRTLVIDALKRDKKLMNQMFLKVGEKEFRFIELSGAYFGFPFGLLMMFIWFFYKPIWFLPIGGLLLGYMTNWLALKMIFKPQQPKKIGPFVLQGLFFKRQKEVSAGYAHIVASEILNPSNIVDAILRGPLSDGLFRLISGQIKKAVDKEAGLTKSFLQFIIGTKEYIQMKHKVCDRIMIELPSIMKAVHNYGKEALDIENTLYLKLSSLKPQEFEEILHPAFKEDEWILILIGAILGAIAGILQMLMFK